MQVRGGLVLSSSRRILATGYSLFGMAAPSAPAPDLALLQVCCRRRCRCLPRAACACCRAPTAATGSHRAVHERAPPCCGRGLLTLVPCRLVLRKESAVQVAPSEEVQQQVQPLRGVPPGRRSRSRYLRERWWRVAVWLWLHVRGGALSHPHARPTSSTVSPLWAPCAQTAAARRPQWRKPPPVRSAEGRAWLPAEALQKARNTNDRTVARSRGSSCGASGAAGPTTTRKHAFQGYLRVPRAPHPTCVN